VLAFVVLVGTSAVSAQGVDLTGRYRCVQFCRDGLVGQPAYITQYGRDLNLLNEAGEPSRAWVDWNGRIWAQSYNEGAVYSPDGLVIQFDRGTIWQRELAEPAPVPAAPPRAAKPARPAVAAAPVERAARNSFDGSWSVVISTRSGGCDPEYRFGVEIVDGAVVYEGGGAAAVQGSVAPGGGVWVSVASGGQRADGHGRLSRNAGSGTWQGQGIAGACAGVWHAARRG
jgi:hypothetical protein